MNTVTHRRPAQNQAGSSTMNFPVPHGEATYKKRQHPLFTYGHNCRPDFVGSRSRWPIPSRQPTDDTSSEYPDIHTCTHKRTDPLKTSVHVHSNQKNCTHNTWRTDRRGDNCFIYIYIFCSISFITVSFSPICCLIVPLIILYFLDILEDLLIHKMWFQFLKPHFQVLFTIPFHPQS